MADLENINVRYLPSWSKPPGLDLKPDPNHQSADPTGNRAQRRRAKKLGIVTAALDHTAPSTE